MTQLAHKNGIIIFKDEFGRKYRYHNFTNSKNNRYYRCTDKKCEGRGREICNEPFEIYRPHSLRYEDHNYYKNFILNGFNEKSNYNSGKKKIIKIKPKLMIDNNKLVYRHFINNNNKNNKYNIKDEESSGKLHSTNGANVER